MERLMSRPVRKYLYAVTIAAVAVLVGYDVISGEAAPLWLALAAAVLGIVGGSMPEWGLQGLGAQHP